MKKKLCIILLFSILISGCSPSSTTIVTKPTNNEVTTVTFSDDLGNWVAMNPPKKVAVLSGSLADAWLIAGGELSSATEDAWSNAGTTLPSDAISLGSISAPAIETIISSGTDFAILSANISNQVALKDQLEDAGITTAYFDVETFDDYASMMKIFTDITGRSDLYKANVTDLEAAIQEQVLRQDNTHPTVLFLRAHSSGVTAKDSNSMTGRMLKDLGAINIADSNSSFSENLSIESIIAADPDYIFVTTMGASKKSALKSIDELLTTNPAWNSLSAVKNNHYYVLPKELFQNKPNERWAESYETLADILYGE